MQGQQWVKALHEMGSPSPSPCGVAEDALQVPSCPSLPAPGLSLPVVARWQMGGSGVAGGVLPTPSPSLGWCGHQGTSHANTACPPSPSAHDEMGQWPCLGLTWQESISKSKRK